MPYFDRADHRRDESLVHGSSMAGSPTRHGFRKLDDCLGPHQVSSCSSRRLQLNALKTKLQWFGSRANLCKLSSVDLSLAVGDDVIQPATVVRDLGAYPYAELTMNQASVLH